MECFVMNSKRTMLAATAAVLLTAATVTAASAQGRERGGGMGGGMSAGQNLSTGGQVGASGQVNAQGPGASAGTQFQGRVNRSAGTNLGRSQLRTTNRTAMTNNRFGGTYGRDRDRGQFASSARFRDRGQFASSARFRDRNRLAFAGDRSRFVSGGTRFASAGWNGGWNGWGWGGGWNNGWGWGGPSFGVSFGGWGWPGWGSGLYSYAPGVSVGFGGGCTCGAPGWWR
jgi:hypothetical protein